MGNGQGVLFSLHTTVPAHTLTGAFCVVCVVCVQASIIDSLDTLYLMGMEDEFKRARDWVASFDFIMVPTPFLLSHRSRDSSRQSFNDHLRADMSALSKPPFASSAASCLPTTCRLTYVRVDVCVVLHERVLIFLLRRSADILGEGQAGGRRPRQGVPGALALHGH